MASNEPQESKPNEIVEQKQQSIKESGKDNITTPNANILTQSDKFEIKLKKLVEKYGKINKELDEEEKLDPDKLLDEEDDGDTSDDGSEDSDNNQSKKSSKKQVINYYFTYNVEVLNDNGEKVYSTNMIDLDDFFYTSPVSSSIPSSVGKGKNEKVFSIVFHDPEMIELIQEVGFYQKLFESPPNIETETLFYSINDLRIRYNEGRLKSNPKSIKFYNPKIKLLIDFTEELFNDKIDPMEKMIEAGKIDFKSLWYLFDKIGTVYQIKMFEEDVCLQHESFAYSTYERREVFVFNTYVYRNQKTIFHRSEYSHRIFSFTGSKDISSLKIKIVHDSFEPCYQSSKIKDIMNSIRVTDDEREKMLKNGDQVLDIYDKISHMNVKGTQLKQGRNSIISTELNERVMVDPEGLEKYANYPIPLVTEEAVNIDEFKESNNKKMCLFPFIGIYNLGVKKDWGITHIQNLSPIQYEDNAFDYLVLDKRKKKVIKALIKNFKDDDHHDFIKKKGNGLVFLLWGPPGVGKTLTVEATSELLHKPLYNMSVGDLGTSPEHMDKIMNDIVEYVNRWGAIMLIDEADIFLERRVESHITRNAMVSVFLKFLEYHDGIIFLTTNLGKNLDPAVYSRINMSLSYHDSLDNKTRKKIWKGLLENWGIEVEKETLNELARKKINGRQIRNYMKVVFAIHKEDEMEMTDKSLLATLEECYELSEEFDKNLPSMYQ